jgi:hypothetical protein
MCNAWFFSFAHSFTECENLMGIWKNKKIGHVKPSGVGFIGIWCALGFALSSIIRVKPAPLSITLHI